MEKVVYYCHSCKGTLNSAMICSISASKATISSIDKIHGTDSVSSFQSTFRSTYWSIRTFLKSTILSLGFCFR